MAKLETVVKNLVNECVVLQARPLKYKFGCLNYGEVVREDWRNCADGDKWDIFAPGYNTVLPTGVVMQVERVLGVFLLSNGNHKIAVRLKCSEPYSDRRANDETRRYVMEYTRRMRLIGTYVPYYTVR